MAFKILTKDEINLLNEKEKRIYLEEYELYLERCALVEKLERYGKIGKKCHSSKRVKLKRITANEIKYKKTKNPKINLNTKKIKIKSDEELLRVTNIKIEKNNLAIKPQKVKMPNLYKRRVKNPEIHRVKLDNVNIDRTAELFIDDFVFDAVNVSTKAEKVNVSVPEIHFKNDDKYTINKLKKIKTDIPDINVDIPDNYVVPNMNTVNVRTPNIKEFKTSEIELVQNHVKVFEPNKIQFTKDDYSINMLEKAYVAETKDIQFKKLDLGKIETTKIDVRCPNVQVKIPDIQLVEEQKIKIESPNVKVNLSKLDRVKKMHVETIIPKVPNIKIEKVQIDKVNVKCINPVQIIDTEHILNVVTNNLGEKNEK